MIELFGVTVHDPDVVFTDLGLAVLGGYLGWRLWASSDPGALQRAGAVLMGGLASAALWGAIFHAFFPAQTATLAGFVAWIPVALSILVVAATLLQVALSVLAMRLASMVRNAIVVTYTVSFAAVVLLVDESFAMIVRFYAPALLLFLIAAVYQAIRTHGFGWTLIALGFTVSAVGSALQQAGLAIHPTYFDHNATYHVVQGVAVALVYLGFRRVPPASVSG